MAILHMLAIDVIFFGIARYRLVVEPACMLIAAFSVTWIAARLGGGERSGLATGGMRPPHLR